MRMMKNFWKIHNISILIYLVGFPSAIFLIILSKRLFTISIPSVLIPLTAFLGIFISSISKLIVWRKRKTFLSEQERVSFQAKSFLFIACAEFAAGTLGVFMLLTS